MPIRPSEKARYPKEWPQIRARILARDRHRCRWCGVENYAVVRRHSDGWEYPRGNAYWDQQQYRTSHADACEARDFLNEWDPEPGEPRWIVIVLTVAHLNHTPEDNGDENLAALCPRCHLTHDARLHASNARRTRAEKVGQGELPL